MEFISNEQFKVLTNPGVSSIQLLSPHNSNSSRITITRVTVEPGAVQERHLHATSEQVWIALNGSGMLLLAEGKSVSIKQGEVIRFADGDIHGFENTSSEQFVYLSVTSPPINFSYAYSDPVISALSSLLSEHSDKRVCVVGTTCTGKSTMLSQIPGARDQDKEIFPKLTEAEKTYVCQIPWTEEIGRTMTQLVRDRVLSEVGRPLFGTVVVDCDLIVLLKISDELLARRVALRNAQFSDAKNMASQIEGEVRASGIPHTEYSVG